MELAPFFKSLIDQDDMPVVICDITDTIVYMNPAAEEHYEDSLGGKLVGRSVLDCHPMHAAEKLRKVTDWFAESRDHNTVHTMYIESRNTDVYMIALRDCNGDLIGYYEKHVPRTRDTSGLYRMRAVR